MVAIEEIKNRLDSLEARIRRNRRLTGATVLVLAVSYLVGEAIAGDPSSPHQDEVRAKRFVLIDDDGDCRASLGFGPGVMVHGRSEPGFESAILNLFAKSNDTRITLMVMHDGRPGMMLIGKDGKSRMTARLLPDGNPVVWFIDDKNKDRLKLSLEADGKPSIVFKDQAGQETIFTP